MLYVIPVFMPTLGNPSALYLQKFVNRKSERGSGLNSDGELDRKANILIKKGVFVDYDPTRIGTMKNDLNKLIPDFEVRTNFEDINVDKIMEAAKKRHAKEGVWKKWNNFENIEGLDKGYMEADDEAAFKEKVEIYAAHAKSQITRNTSILKDAMISAIKTGQAISTSAYNPDKDTVSNHLLKEYLNDE